MERPKQRKWWFGVCADFSEKEDIPVSIVRLFVLLYIPVRLGPVFYFIYYWVIRNREPLPLKSLERDLQISKIKIHYYGS